jgi:hypothetical protein
VRTKLAVGADLDVITPAELARAVEPIRHAILSLSQAPTIIHHIYVTATTATGTLGGGAGGDGEVAYEAPVGRRVDIQRILIESPAVTPAAPMAVGWIRLCRNSAKSAAEVFWPKTGTTSIPVLETDGDPAIRLNNNDRVVINGAALTPSIEVVIQFQLRLWADYPIRRGEQIP